MLLLLLLLLLPRWDEAWYAVPCCLQQGLKHQQKALNLRHNSANNADKLAAAPPGPAHTW
jgi:hypothetical protein